MKLDFTISIYRELLEALISSSYTLLTFRDYLKDPDRRCILIRQDMDMLPENSLRIAEIQHAAGIQSTFYVRTVPGSYNPGIVRKIYDLGHEIGYHYEDVSLAVSKNKYKTKSTSFQELEKSITGEAIISFEKNLGMLRQLSPVDTICMHGSPLSSWDGRLLWKYYNYNDFNVIGEPYFDVDFSKILYLTDTGRRWDGNRFNVRDKYSNQSGSGAIHRTGHESQGIGNPDNWKTVPKLKSAINATREAAEFQKKFTFRKTYDIIRTIEPGFPPEGIMMTFHPQRWASRPLPWLKELIWQNVKNSVKYILVRKNMKRSVAKSLNW